MTNFKNDYHILHQCDMNITMETFSEGGPTPQFGIWKLSHKPNLSHAIFQPILILE